MKFKLLYIALFLSSISFGQQVISEEVLIKNDSIELPGTLTYSKENTPLIIWIHGSGNVDRNGNQAGVNIRANYIKQFRDSINKHNIAFFSYDKRSSNKKNFKHLKGTLFKDFVEDANKVIVHFKNDTRFSEIILIGHSQGSLVAMLASKDIDKYISLAGPSDSFDKAIVRQITKQSPVFGEAAKAHFKELLETGTIKEVNPLLVSVFAKQNLDFIKNYTKYNPSEEIKKLTVPILIINGTKDLQVKVEDAQSLHKAAQTSKLVIIKNMNHVLKNIEKDSDNMNSYYSAEFKLSTELITTIVAFLKK